MDKKQPEALSLAEIARYCFRSEGMSDPPEQFESPTGDMVDYFDHVDIEKALLARITELESQLAQRFDAADMATAAAQGFRGGAAAQGFRDGAAKEQQAGAFQAALDIRTAQGWQLGGDKAPVLYTDEINGQQVCRDDVWLCTTDAFTHPSPPEGMAVWTTLPGQMPEPNTPVLLDIGKKYPIRALWAAKRTVEAADDDTDWAEYDVATETYYCPEGWYEWNEHEEIHWAVAETPRAWAPLPPTTPAGSGKGE